MEDVRFVRPAGAGRGIEVLGGFHGGAPFTGLCRATVSNRHRNVIRSRNVIPVGRRAQCPRRRRTMEGQPTIPSERLSWKCTCSIVNRTVRADRGWTVKRWRGDDSTDYPCESRSLSGTLVRPRLAYTGQRLRRKLHATETNPRPSNASDCGSGTPGGSRPLIPLGASLLTVSTSS